MGKEKEKLVRVYVDIETGVQKAAKVLAARSGKSLKSIVEEAITSHVKTVKVSAV